MLVAGLYDDHTQFQVPQKNLGSCTCANSGCQALVSNFFQAPVNEARHKFLPLVFVPRIHLGKVEAAYQYFSVLFSVSSAYMPIYTEPVFHLEKWTRGGAK